MMIAAKKSSPLVIGLGKENDYYVASDATPFVEYTNEVVNAINVNVEYDNTPNFSQAFNVTIESNKIMIPLLV